MLDPTNMALLSLGGLAGLINLSMKALLATYCILLGHNTEGCSEVETQFTYSTMLRQISSTGYHPNQPYDNDEDKCWHLKSTVVDAKVVVGIRDMDIEESLDCRADYLEFRDGDDENASLLARLCGTTVGSYTSTRGSMFIRFKTDSEDTHRGFLLEFYEIIPSQDGIHVLDNVCDNVTPLTATTSFQTILSPEYPQNYGGGIDTCWSITVDNIHYIKMEVTETELEYGRPCTLADFVQAMDGPDTTSKLLSEWCGQEKPSYVQSTGSTMLIRFRSNYENNIYKGFKIRYWAVSANSNGGLPEDGGLDSTERVMLGVGILITSALIVSAFVYHKKYGKRRANAVSHVGGQNSRRDSRGNPSQRHRWARAGGGHGQGTIITPGEPGVYPSYSAPARPAYGPQGAPPVPPGMIIAPPPYSARDEGGTPLGPPPSRELEQILTLDANMTPPPSYDDVIKDDPPDYPFDPPNYVSEPQPSANQSSNRGESNSSQTNQNNPT